MSNKYHAYKEIPKRVQNGIKARIDAAVSKYGYEEFRLCANKYIENVREKEKLEEQIKENEEKLKKLKSKR